MAKKVKNDLKLFKALCYAVGYDLDMSVTNSLEFTEDGEPLENKGAGCTITNGDYDDDDDKEYSLKLLQQADKILKKMGVVTGELWDDGESLGLNINWDDNRDVVFKRYKSYIESEDDVMEWYECDLNIA